jgi:hypothetical protein
MSNAAAPADTTVDPSINAAVEEVYNYVLSQRNYPPDTPPEILYCADKTTKKAGILNEHTTLELVNTFINNTPTIQNKQVVLAYFLKRYGYRLINFLDLIDIKWPPVPMSTYNIPGYIGETFFSAMCRVYEKLMGPTETFEQFYGYLRQEPISADNITTLFVNRIKDVNPGDTFTTEYNRLNDLFEECKVVNNKIYSTEAAISRHVDRILRNKTYDDYAMSFIAMKKYTEIEVTEFISSVYENWLTDSTDWRQQIFIIIPTDDDNIQNHTLQTISSSGGEKSFDELASLQFNYDPFRRDKLYKNIGFNDPIYTNIMFIQGYMMYEHGHFLMAVASGIKYASPKALARLPELFNPVSRFAWLEARMVEWATRIQSLPRVEKEIEQRQFEIVQRYINRKKSESMAEIGTQQQQQTRIQTKGEDQASRMATNLEPLLRNLIRGVDPNIVYKQFNTNFRPKYALRLNSSNIAPIKKRKTGFFFGESRKAYQPRLYAQLRELQTKLKSMTEQKGPTTFNYQESLIKIYRDIQEMREGIGIGRSPTLLSGSIEDQIEFITQQIRDIKTQLTKQSGSGRRFPRYRFTRRKRHTRRRSASKKTKSRTRRA